MKNEKVIELLAIDADNLKQKQFDALKQHGINVLETLVTLLKQNKFKEIIGMTFYSPAGDGMGNDNYCIDFGWGEHDETDIGDYIKMLESLSSKKI